MTIRDIANLLPESAKDIKLNLTSVTTVAGAPGLSEVEINLIAVASAIATKDKTFAASIKDAVGESLEAEQITDAETAAALMAMNNVYYRFLHLVEDKDYATMPARLRMNGMANPSVGKRAFELMSLAVSAINGCGMCMASHNKMLIKEGVSKEAIQSAARIAAVINATQATLAYRNQDTEAKLAA